MKIDIEDINSTKKKLKLAVPPDQVGEAFKHAYRKVRKKANIKGFRKGKIPDQVLDQHFGSDIHIESLNFLVNQTYSKALQDHHLAPVLDPQFNNLKALEKGKEYSYEVEVEVKPQFELKSYLEIPLKKRQPQIDPAEVESELKKLQESRAELKPVEPEASLQEGFVGTLDFEGMIGGKSFPGGAATDYAFEPGKGRLLKEFEKKITGMKVGEEREIEISYPPDYHDEQFRGKKAQFKIKLNALHQKVLPLIDDEFAKDIGKDNLAAVKKNIEDFLTKREERSHRNEYAKEVIDYLTDKNPFDVPQGLIEREMKQPHEGEKKNEKEVAKSIQLQFIIEAVARKESIRVTPQEIESHFQYLSGMYQQPLASIKKYFKEENRVPQLVMQLVLSKTLDFLIDKAKLS